MILICVGIVILSGVAGSIYASKYINKFKFFNELVDFCSFLQININFNQDKLPLLFNKYCDNKKSQFKLIIKQFSDLKYIKRLDDLTIKQKLILPDYLINEQSESILTFLLRLGEVDSFNQINSIENYKLKFNNYKELALTDKNKNANLIYKLSIGIGLVIAIIIF